MKILKTKKVLLKSDRFNFILIFEARYFIVYKLGNIEIM